MRSSDCGMVQKADPLPVYFSTGESLEMFRRMCLIRYFELNLKKAYDAGLMPKIPIYLSAGQETIASALSMIFPHAALFGQHRCHDIYLAFGGNPIKLIDELLGRPTGCAGGMGGSASIHSPEIRMFGHDGLMGSQVPIAVGYALGCGQKTIAFMGDASAEEGYVLGAIGYGATKKAPVLFVVCDNGLSILTKTEVRRSWSMAQHAGFGTKTAEITDDPWLIMHYAKKLSDFLPALMNIHTCRMFWHAGTGKDGEPEWNRFELVKQALSQLGLQHQSEMVEIYIKNYMDVLWQNRLKEGDNERS